MKPEGWAFLVFGWGITIALFIYCFTRILLGGGERKG
jgi:glycerol uptake facilitator-like aquaporin